MSAKAMIGAISVLSIALVGPDPIRAQDSNAEARRGDPAEAVGRLVEQIKRHPVQPKEAPGRVALYLMDVNTGELTLLADQPEPGRTYCGSPAWSEDGRRILFDATPGTQWALTHLRSLEPGRDRPIATDLGDGNCPTLSPAGDRIAFLSNADGVQRGIWLMKADGSERRPLGEYGIPKWSPDGRQMMISSFGEPREVTIMDSDPEKSGPIHLPGLMIYSVPSWAGAGTIIAIVGAAEGDRVAVIDVRTPARARVKEVLWRRADVRDVKPTYPIYSTATGRCVFVGVGAKGMSLYSLRAVAGARPEPIGKEPPRKTIIDLAFSPDGRYVVHAIHGPD